ncbi:thioesterase-like superfamily-domain-containing protein [Gaertneriomyces semiglobifer]|nr:thioesterase-like superfamily-domain-containing protein [Gaertneriomyces semiglobifer]
MAPKCEFDKVTSVHEIARTEGQSTWQGHISDEWMIGSVPHGGYVLSVILVACKAHFSTTGRHPDPISITAHYLKPSTPQVPCLITVTDLKPGRLALAQFLVKQGAVTTLVGTVTFGDLRAESGPSRITSKPAFPPVCACTKGVFGRVGGTQKSAIGDKVDVVTAPQVPDRAERQQWMRFSDGRQADAISLAFFADAYLPVLTNYGKEFLGGDAWFPTMELNVQFKAHPASTSGRWVAQDIRTKYLVNGRHEVDAELWDEDGNLLAIARQMALVVSWERNAQNAQPPSKL